MRTLAGTGEEGFLDGSADYAQFSSPSNVAIWRATEQWPIFDPTKGDDIVDYNGNCTVNLFVSDTGNHRIRKIAIKYDINESGEYIATAASVECFSGLCNKLPRAGYSDGIKSFSLFDSPRGIAVSANGNVYVADSNNNLIRVIDKFGFTETLAGKTNVHQHSSFDLPRAECRDPCLSGVPGHEDGSSVQAKFSFPTGIAISADGASLFVIDHHYLREINLVKNEVYTIAGRNENGERDGYGHEAAFFHPEGVTVSQDGFIYITDSVSCRIRRVSNQSDYLDPVKCDRTFASVTRPSGCASYNVEIDEFGLGVTPLSGPIYYNYVYRNHSHPALGYDFIGRSLKECVGSPPDGKLTENDTLYAIREDPNEGTMIRIVCSSSCESFHGPIYGVKYDNVYLYSEDSSICLSAFHAGVLPEATNRMIEVIEHQKPLFDGSRYIVFDGFNGERELTFEEIETQFSKTARLFGINQASIDFVVHTISGAPTMSTENSCGFLDSDPAQGAKVCSHCHSLLFILYI